MSGTEMQIATGDATLAGTLTEGREAALVLFAHGSGSSRHSPRNRQVARALNESGVGTLLFDLLTPQEEDADRVQAHLRFNIEFLAVRLMAVTDWIVQRVGDARGLALGYFGASTGAAAALYAAARYGERIGAVVSRGGRPDLAGGLLDQVKAPTLLIVGERDEPVIGMNRQAYVQLRCTKEMVVIPGATHLFEEPGALEQVASLASAWFAKHLLRA